MKRTLLLTLTTLTTLLAWSPAPAQPTLAELAAEADLVALVRVEQVDYQRTRSFPSGGSAFLKVLIPYKGVGRDAWIEVLEKGLGEEKCYYPEPDPFAFEGARFLVMLRATRQDEVYRGVAPGCRIPVLVTADNGYAVRYPVDGLALPEELARPMTFNDPAATIDASQFTSRQIAELEEIYRAVPVEGDPLDPPTGLYVYTQGIPLADVRRAMTSPADPPE